MGYGLVCLVVSLLLALVRAQSTSTQTAFQPAAVPLALRSPYLSAWQNTTNGANVAVEWPQFWNDAEPTPILGWAGMIRIDSITYRWLGDDTISKESNFTNIQVTPTRTIYSVQAGPMDVTVTFLTPIEPSDWVKQSIPFSYVSINATSTDGELHEVQLYSDVSAEWLSSNRSALVNWSASQTGVVYHQVELESPSPFTDVDGQAEDGVFYHAMLAGPNVTYQNGRDQIVRTQFATAGQLAGSQDTQFRAIDDDYPVFGIAINLGSIRTIQSAPVWSVGYVRNPSIKYTTSTGELQLRSPYYVTQYSSIQDTMQAFLNDYSDALSRSIALDNQLTAAAASISAQYSDLLSLAARQTFGAIDITVSNGTDGNWNISDTLIFMKNIGNDGRVTPVEILYAAFPMFLYLNASYCKPLLAPLFEFQSSSFYSLPYAASDIGVQYPFASGNNSSSSEGVEQSGNMLIMTLAAARASGDGSLLGQYYPLLKKWTNYLIENTLTPNNQQSADGQTTANMTNLAIKGIIGIKAMSEISLVVDLADDAQQFANTASTLVSTWQSLAMAASGNSLLFSYGDSDSWALMYNLYADVLLKTDLVDQNVYNVQTEFYEALLNDGSASTYGLPIDSTVGGSQGNSAWMAFTAATASNLTVRDNLISMAWKHAASNLNQGIFPAVYDVSTGSTPNGYASPAQGAMFAPLALDISNRTIVVPPLPSSSSSPVSKSHTNVGAIVGGVVGGIAALAIILLAFLVWRRRTRQVAPLVEKDYILEAPEPESFPYETTPFTAPLNEGRQSLGPQQVVLSSKQREFLQAREADTSSSSYSNTVPPSSLEPPSTVGSDVPSEIVGLRTEVENLRRVMQELQADRLEAPPEYVYED